jgi:hypothetical protein
MKMAEVIVSRIEKDDKESYSDITQELIENFNNKFFLL